MRRPPGMTCGDCGGRVVYTGRHLVCSDCAWDLPEAPVTLRAAGRSERRVSIRRRTLFGLPRRVLLPASSRPRVLQSGLQAGSISRETIVALIEEDR